MNDEELHARLEALRGDIADVDRSLLELLRRRMELAAEVGRVKNRSGEPIVVPEVYDRVLTRARQHAENCGVSPEVMTQIFDAVIRGSVERQHRVGVASRVEGGERLLILGGAGNMGGWLERFASLLGHIVDLVDPALGNLPPQAGRFGSLEAVEDLDRYAAIIVAVPLAHTAAVVEQVAARRPRGLVIEIASIKDPVDAALERAREQGVSVCSLHPMFGPGKSPYEALTFVLACRDDPQEEKERVERWLRHPYTHLVPVPFHHHDRLMGWLLGLAHLSGMLFGCALSHAGLAAGELATCASTTYDRQAATARSVLEEDPELYFDIQRLNPHRGKVYQAARDALDGLIQAVESDDRDAFRQLLDGARTVLAG